MDIKIEKALNHLRDFAPKLAKAKSNQVYLEQFRKTKKALLMVEAQEKGITAGNKQEVYAYAHPEYLELLVGLKVAVEEHEELKHLQIAANLKIECWRTIQANNRKEFGQYGN